MSADTLVWGFLVPLFIFLFSFVVTYALYKKFSREMVSDEKQKIKN